MSKKKAPALHERRGREDISTRPPRLAGYPIKLAGDARLHRLSLAADSCVNRKYYGGDPGVGQRKTWAVHNSTIRPRRRRPGARFSLGQVPTRTKSTLSALRLVRNLRKPCAWPSAARACVDFRQPRFSLADAPTHNPYVGGLMCCIPEDYKVEMKVDRRRRPSSRSLSETQ